MAWLRRRHRHRELDERLEQAQAERRLSEQRLASMRKNTTGPLMKRGQQNQFGEIIRRSLREAPGGQNGGRTA